MTTPTSQRHDARHQPTLANPHAPQPRPEPRPRPRCRGIALVWVAILLIVLVGMVGLASDTALVYLGAHQLQNAADAAALAGAQHLRGDHTRVRHDARQIALANHAARDPVQLDLNGETNDPDGDIVLGRFNRSTGEFQPNAPNPNAVRVIARRTEASLNDKLPLVFGSIFGIDSVNVQREAIAMVGGGTGGGLITLNHHEPCSLRIRGNTHLDVNGGDIQINSGSDQAMCTHGNSFTVEAPRINMHGDHDLSGSGTYMDENGNEFEDLDELIRTQQRRLNDPLAFLEPEYNDPKLPGIYENYENIREYETDLGGIRASEADDSVFYDEGTDTYHYSPGYYSSGITVTGGNVELAPGVYVVDDVNATGNQGGLQINGGTFNAEGVMFYVMGGAVDIGGNAIVNVTPYDDETSDYAGINIFQARHNHEDATIIGSGNLNLEGTLYFPENHLNVGGTGAGFGNQLIADTIEMHGGGSDGRIEINYDGDIPAVGNDIFLVR